MASLDIAQKANQAAILPGILLERYLEIQGYHPQVAKNIHQEPSLPDKTSICLRLEDGKTFADDQILSYCRDVVSRVEEDKISRVSSDPITLTNF